MPTKRQIKEQEKVIKNILIVIGFFLMFFLIVFFSINSAKKFEYKGVDYKIVKEGNLIFYNTAFPLINKEGKHVADYNIYFRNDPRKLDDILFDGDGVTLKSDMVLNMTKEFNCDGDGIIAIANFVQVMDKVGVKVIKDPEAGCDAIKQRYTFVQIRPGNETYIEKFAPSCYNFYVNDCEILKVTEKFMAETFAKMKQNA